MKTCMTPAQAEHQLTPVADQCDHWRQTRTTRGEPLPHDLWEQAIAFTTLFPMTRVASRLRVRGPRMNLVHEGEDTMRRNTLLHTLGWALLAAATFAALPAMAQETRPNVVFILADNVGYGDLGPYGGGELRGAPTPRIDQLAREGLRLTQYLVEPGCTPSRAALMTGQYSIRNGLSLIIVPGSDSTLSARAVTMGELFKGVGYATAIFGKWHLGAEPQSLPTAHGFDEFYGIPPDISWDSATYVDTIEPHALHARAARRAPGQRTANRRGRRGRSLAHGQAVHAGSPGRDQH